MFHIVNMIEPFSKARQSKARQKAGFYFKTSSHQTIIDFYLIIHMVHKSKKGKNQYETKVNGIYAVMSYIKHNTHVLIRMPKE